MPAYHSTSNEVECFSIGSISLLSFDTKLRLPPSLAVTEDDIITEAITLFRPNSLFRNFEIKGNADRLLIYLILFIGDLLNRIQAKSYGKLEALKQLSSHAIDNFILPYSSGFPLQSIYSVPTNKVDGDKLRSYLSVARQELVLRLVDILYKDDLTKPDKYWMSFQKRKFMGKSL